MIQRVAVSRGIRAAVQLSRNIIAVLALLTIATTVHGQATSIAGRVTDVGSGGGIGDAQVRLVGTQQGTITRDDGSYTLRVLPGRHIVRAARIGFGSRTDTVDVAVGQTATLNFVLARATINLDQVIVTGTRATDRTVLEAPAPIDVLSAEDIRSTGLTETSQVLQRLAPSLNFPRPSVNDGTDHVRPATLRGLGPDQALVLINGKRRHNTALVHVNQSVGRGSSSVDLNAIPVSAIERIEVLRDGAASQYGSDAIAGVINIILKSGEQASLSTTVGRVQSQPDGAPKYKDGGQVQVDGNFGRMIMGDGFFHLAGEFRNRNRTNRARADTTVQCDPLSAFPCNEIPFGTSPYDKDVIQSWQGDSESEDWTFFLNSELPLQPGVRLYGSGGFGKREGLAAGFHRRSLDDRTIRAFYGLNGFLPQIGADIKDLSGSLGVKGSFRGWRWDLGGVYGGNTFEFSVHNSANVSQGLLSPRDFYAGALKYNQGTLNLDFVRPFSATVVGPLNIAIGAELRRENYQLERGDTNSYSDGGVRILDGRNAGNRSPPFAQVFPGFRPVDEADESRTNLGAYIDVEATPIPRLLVAVAGRAEDYSDFGSTLDGKIAARLELLAGLAVRGAVQTGFRAPSLGQSLFSSVATNFVGGVPFEIRTFAVGSPGAQLLGAKALEPEESVNLSGGLTFQLLNALSLSADVYQIKIDNRVVLSGNFIDPSVRTLLAANGITGVSGARYFTNAIDTETKGFDVVANYGMNLDRAGFLRLTAGYNHNKTEVTRVSPTPPQLSAVRTALFDRVQRNLIQRGQPRDGISLAANHTFRGLSTNLNARRFGEITIYQSVTATTADPNAPADPTFRPDRDQRFDAKWVTDLSLGFRIFDLLGITLGANNIFDTYPDTVITFNQTRGIQLYAGASPMGFNGRYIFARAAIDFVNLASPFRRAETVTGRAADQE